MMRLSYAGGDLLTGSAIATAVLRYAAALSEADMATTIDVPGRTLDGVEGRFGLLIGPASQILVEPTDDPEEIEDDEFLGEIEHLTKILTDPPNVMPSDEAIDFGLREEFE